ncbi:hypothetical protein CJ030_MR3G018256 [Morella rubra]|uniref:Uncharacterized protein n=1 Tax=Morella rubra TaxID=262757 RepID=A0A6A1W436_9ROSI|nr:hypothetical protein CJ030_MR3G018256 [Morella rubra]
MLSQDDEDPFVLVSASSVVDVDTRIVAKGFKTREPKHKGNKRLKSRTERRSSRGCDSARGYGVGCASSQPVSHRLQQLDELEASNEDEEEENNEEDDGEDK